jgi:flagellar capping protein FliD
MVDAVEGVTLQLSQVTTAPVEITIENDLDAIQKNIQSFVDAYNTLNATLADATKYDAAANKRWGFAGGLDDGCAAKKSESFSRL